jgi:stearoyl-CoA desaturase (delta-9 desaturase)
MIYLFLMTHWLFSVLLQSLFQHRYAAHRMYAMGHRTERLMHLLAAVVQGSSFLEPRAYAILHREHHAFADTERDPHSPSYDRGVFRMMRRTAERYSGYVTRRAEPEARFLGGYPEWPAVDRFFSSWSTRIGIGGLYTAFYLKFARRPWQLAFLPLHWGMGPVQGAIVNWCGHKHGYRNFDTRDQSRNSLPVDVVTMGELFQNNHHARPSSPDFGARRFEIDPTWAVMRLLAKLGIIQLTPRGRPEGLTRGAASGEPHPPGGDF